MTTVFAFLFMLTIVAAMAVGVIMGRKPIAGSCGGMKALGLDSECEVCGGNPDACSGSSNRRQPTSTERAEALGSDATRRQSADRDVRTL